MTFACRRPVLFRPMGRVYRRHLEYALFFSEDAKRFVPGQARRALSGLGVDRERPSELVREAYVWVLSHSSHHGTECPLEPVEASKCSFKTTKFTPPHEPGCHEVPTELQEMMIRRWFFRSPFRDQRQKIERRIEQMKERGFAEVTLLDETDLPADHADLTGTPVTGDRIRRMTNRLARVTPADVVDLGIPSGNLDAVKDLVYLILTALMLAAAHGDPVEEPALRQLVRRWSLKAEHLSGVKARTFAESLLRYLLENEL